VYRGDDRLGITPCEAAVDPAADPVEFTFRLKGFRIAKVAADARDGALVEARLVRARGGGSRRDGVKVIDF
jgi:hypothetical protein